MLLNEIDYERQLLRPNCTARLAQAVMLLFAAATAAVQPSSSWCSSWGVEQPITFCVQ
jgi:hypothetical protein